jgi:PAS domain S-box-containing protein
MDLSSAPSGDAPVVPATSASTGRALAEGILALGLCTSEQSLQQTLLSRAAALLASAHWVLGLVVGDGEAIEVLAISSGLRLRFGDGLIGRRFPALNSPFTRKLFEAHLPAFAASDAELPEVLQTLLPLKSLVGIPLLSEDVLDGVLLAGALEGEASLAPTPQVMEDLTNLARVGALAWRRLRTQGELQRQLAQGKRLNRLIWDFQSAASEAALWEDPKGLFTRLLELLADHAQVEMGILWSVRTEQRALQFMASSGLPDLGRLMEEGMLLDGPSAGPSAWAALSGDVEEIPDAQADPRCAPYLEEYARSGTRSVYAIPLLGQGGAVLGVLTLYRREVGPMPQESRAAARVFASLTALALERTRLWDRLQTELRNRIESEQRYRILVEESRLGVFLAQDGNILYANPTLHRILGVPLGGLDGRPLAESFGEEADALAGLPAAEVLAALKGIHLHVSRPGGGTLPLELHLSEVELKGGRGVLGTVEDITERYLAQEAMRHATLQAESLAKATHAFSEAADEESLLRALFLGAGQIAPLRHWWFNARNSRGEILTLLWTPEMEQRLGLELSRRFPENPRHIAKVYERGERVFFPDMEATDYFPRDVLEVFQNRTFGAFPLLADGHVQGVLNGGTFGDEGIVYLEEDQLQALESLASSAAVALSRLRAQAQVMRSEARFRQLFEDAGDAVFLVGPRGIEMANLAAERLLGRAFQDLKGLGPEDLSPMTQPNGRDSEQALMEARLELREGRGVLMEWTFLRPDGKEVPTQMNLSILRGGESGRVQAIVRDLTEAKQVEAEKAALERQLFQAQKMESLGVLAGGIAHDFNNLLMGVLGHASLALDQLPTEHALRKNLQAIQRAGEKAADLTRQMLAYSGRGQFLVRNLNLNQQVEEMTHLLEVSLPKTVKLELTLSPQLPSIAADAAQLQQVIMNLVINAAEAIGEATGHIRIATGLQELDSDDLVEMVLGHSGEAGSYVYLEVKDTGCGMDAMTQTRIFEPFFTTKFTGRGLGLAALAGIVRGHHGVLRVRSVPGAGTEFRVFFPAQPGVQGVMESPHGACAVSGEGLVLVVDDEEIVRAVARQALESRGFEVMEATDGVEGVACVEREGSRIRVVLLDMTMPRMGGEAAFRAMRKIRPDIPVLLSSGYSEQDTLARFQGAYIQGFIQKPYRPRDLAEKVLEAMGEKDAAERDLR